MKIRGNKGITMIALIITIVVLLIISSVIIVEMNTGDKFKDYQYMKADIEVIENSILVYYHNYAELPIDKENSLSSVDLHGQASAKDDADKYYEIILNKLGNMTLNYGKKDDSTDMYIINEKSHEVYYLKGIEDEEGVLKHQ